MTATPAPAARRRSLAPGILLGVLAVLLLITAAIIYGVSQIGARLNSSPAVEIPQALELDLAAGDYDVYLTDDSIRDISDPVAAIVCIVEAGGSQQEVRGSDQNFIGSEENDDELIGGFATPGGPTTVTCDFADGHASTDYFYRVQPASPGVSTAALVLLAAGLVAGGASALIIVFRVRARPRS
jgi:hypothetical protein